jgi:hypothetical protein
VDATVRPQFLETSRSVDSARADQARRRDRAPERRPQKITFGEMRSSGVRGILIYCSEAETRRAKVADAEV